MTTSEEMEELRQDMLLEDWNDEQYEMKMVADDDFFGEDLVAYYDNHTVIETIEYIEHYNRDVDDWFDFMLKNY